MSDQDFPAKWRKVLPENFSDEADSKKNDELQSIILKSSTAINELEKDMDNDAKLLALKEDLKHLMGGYKETMREEQAKIKYCLHLLRNRGAA
jgi:hypothetical protein